MNKIRELKKLDIKGLRQKLIETKKELVRLGMLTPDKKEKDVHLYKKKKKEIARILTLIREEELKQK